MKTKCTTEHQLNMHDGSILLKSCTTSLKDGCELICFSDSARWGEMRWDLISILPQKQKKRKRKKKKKKRACNIHHVSAGPGLTQRAKYTVNHVHGDSPECGLSFTSYISICISNVFTITAFSWAMRVITLVDTGRCIYKLNLPQMIMSNPGENSSWMRERIIIMLKIHFVLFAIQWTKQTNKQKFSWQR